MSDVGDIDIGLSTFSEFIKKGNRSLLIKGGSGTGKVTLCFELAKSHLDEFEIILITRNSPENSIYKRFPWVNNILESKNIISINTASDYMLSEPSFLINHIITTINNLTTTVSDPFVSLEDKKKPFVILEIWDHLRKEMNDATLIKIEKLLTTLTEKNDGFIIFLTEDFSNTLDYFVDGVIKLVHNFYKSYRLREMEIEKLKGTHISRAKIPFTLEEGRFKTFTRLSHKISYKNPKLFVPILDSNKSYHSSGNIKLDKKLNGGFRKGSIISIEIEEDVDRFVFVPLFSPIVLNFICQDKGALVISASDQYASAVTKYLSPHVNPEKFNKFFRIIGGAGVDYKLINGQISTEAENQNNYSKDLDKVLYNENPFNNVFMKWLQIYNNLKENFTKCVITIDYSFVELDYPNEPLIQKSIIELSRRVRKFDDLLITVSRPNYRSLDVLKSISDIHIKLFEHNGAVMMAAIKPQLFFYNIQNDYGEGYPKAVFLDST